jgi:hypothetical protein
MSCPPAVARSLPRDLHEIAGHTIGACAMKHVDDVRGPGALLRERGGEGAEFVGWRRGHTTAPQA